MSRFYFKARILENRSSKHTKDLPRYSRRMMTGKGVGMNTLYKKSQKGPHDKHLVCENTNREKGRLCWLDCCASDSNRGPFCSAWMMDMLRKMTLYIEELKQCSKIWCRKEIPALQFETLEYSALSLTASLWVPQNCCKSCLVTCKRYNFGLFTITRVLRTVHKKLC